MTGRSVDTKVSRVMEFGAQESDKRYSTIGMQHRMATGTAYDAVESLWNNYFFHY